MKPPFAYYGGKTTLAEQPAQAILDTLAMRGWSFVYDRDRDKS